MFSNLWQYFSKYANTLNFKGREFGFRTKATVYPIGFEEVAELHNCNCIWKFSYYIVLSFQKHKYREQFCRIMKLLLYKTKLISFIFTSSTCTQSVLLIFIGKNIKLEWKTITVEGDVNIIYTLTLCVISARLTL